jgi:hypothetical protein
MSTEENDDESGQDTSVTSFDGRTQHMTIDADKNSDCCAHICIQTHIIEIGVCIDNSWYRTIVYKN